LGEDYPHTYTNGDGYSINAGWTTTPSKLDRANTNDPRLAGIIYSQNPDADHHFHVDLSSGSAPGAGTYTIDVAVGDAGNSWTQNLTIKDNTTTLITIGPVTPATGHFIDATGADVAATTTWTGATASKTFASTDCWVDLLAPLGGNLTSLAHFRLTLQGGGGGQSVVPVLMAQYRARGA
jgi:hypothetical protein